METVYAVRVNAYDAEVLLRIYRKLDDAIRFVKWYTTDPLRGHEIVIENPCSLDYMMEHGVHSWRAMLRNGWKIALTEQDLH